MKGDVLEMWLLDQRVPGSYKRHQRHEEGLHAEVSKMPIL